MEKSETISPTSHRSQGKLSIVMLCGLNIGKKVSLRKNFNRKKIDVKG